MRIGDKTNFLSTGAARIPKGKGGDIVLTVRALPIGFQERLVQMVPPPHPASHGCKKVGVARDPNNPNQVLKDASGAPMIEYDLENPRFKAAQAKCRQLETVAMFFEATKDMNPDLEFDAKWADFEKPVQFFEAIYREMQEAEISLGDLGIIIRKTVELSNLNEEKINEATGGFLLEDSLMEGSA